MNLQPMMVYLKELEENNNREWYHAHKKQQQEAAAIFTAIVGELSLRVGLLEGSAIYQEPKALIYRMARDTRFRANKQPYEAAFRSHISDHGKELYPLGYYLHIMPGDRSFVACGWPAANVREAAEKIRDYLAGHGEAFHSIVTEPEFSRQFTIEGEALKKVPKAYDPQHPQAEYLKHKSWIVRGAISDGQFETVKGLCDAAMEKIQCMKPFKDYLNQALSGFVMTRSGR